MKKELKLGLIIGVAIIIIVAIFLLIKNPLNQTGSFVTEDEQNSDEQLILENVVFTPFSLGVFITSGEGKTETIEITNNDKKTLFFRCGIYDAYSNDENAPDLTCETSEQTDKYGFIQITSGEKKNFAIKITTKKNAPYMNAEGNVYKVTTNDGNYNNKVLISAGIEPKEQDTKEILISILVE